MTADVARFAQQAISRATAVRVRNVLNPLLWLSAVTLPSSLVGAYVLRDYPWFSGPLLGVDLLCPLSSVVGFAYFALRDPQRLHSEEFLIQQQRLMLEARGASPVSADSVAMDAKPELAAPHSAGDPDG